MLTGQFQQLAHSDVRRYGHGVLEDAGLIALHLEHFRSLCLDAQILVDDADSTFLCEGNRQPRFGHRIHGGRDKRYVEGDFPGQSGYQTDIARKDRGMGRNEEDVVERQCFLNNAHFQCVPAQIHIIRTAASEVNSDMDLCLFSKGNFIDGYVKTAYGASTLRMCRTIPHKDPDT